ncbi:MAG: thioredoxin family protein [Usitatibacteraceae bacterium]
MNATVNNGDPERAMVDALSGATLLEFGNTWCGHCARAQPLIASALTAHSEVRHIKIADGPGQPLGRSFGVKLWPTLIFLDAGKEITRLVRPVDSREIAAALASIDRRDD